jgi:hypothetical protein
MRKSIRAGTAGCKNQDGTHFAANHRISDHGTPGNQENLMPGVVASRHEVYIAGATREGCVFLFTEVGAAEQGMAGGVVFHDGGDLGR